MTHCLSYRLKSTFFEIISLICRSLRECSVRKNYKKTWILTFEVQVIVQPHIMYHKNFWVFCPLCILDFKSKVHTLKHDMYIVHARPTVGNRNFFRNDGSVVLLYLSTTSKYTRGGQILDRP